MTDTKQDTLDQTIAEWMGWKEIPTGEWHCNLQPLRYRCPSPTRVPADTCALEDYLWEKGKCAVIFPAGGGHCFIKQREKTFVGKHETRAVALCLAVVKMIEEE